jgi:intracellular sulfur oxidation DsrE/DsrF family protein
LSPIGASPERLRAGRGLIGFVGRTRSGVVRIAELQSKGFAYLKAE